MGSMNKKLGKYIVPCDLLNDSEEITLLQGISNEKYFQECKSNTNDIDLSRYRICRKGWFAYNRATTRNGDKISIAYREDDDCLVSPSYKCFKIVDETKLLSQYLLLWFKRPEFDRYARFKSHGSAHEYFEYEEMCDVELPVPDIEEQRKIVNAYSSIEKRISILRAINDNLDEQMRLLLDKHLKSSNTNAFVKLRDISVMEYGYTESATEKDTGTKFLRITDISQSSLDWSSVPYCNISSANLTKYQLNVGDVVVARTGATVGYAKMIGKYAPKSVFASFLVRVKPLQPEYKNYLGITITSADFLRFVQENAGGSAQPQANPPLLGEYPLLLPNVELIDQYNRISSTFISKMELNEIEISQLLSLQKMLLAEISSR